MVEIISRVQESSVQFSVHDFGINAIRQTQCAKPRKALRSLRLIVADALLLLDFLVKQSLACGLSEHEPVSVLFDSINVRFCKKRFLGKMMK